MRRNAGKPIGFAYREFDNWAEALECSDVALSHIMAAAGRSNWMACHVRELRCRALEATNADSKAFLALAEQAETIWQLLPRYCDGLNDLHSRLNATKERIPAALRVRLEEKAKGLYGKGLDGLEIDVKKVKAWLSAANDAIRDVVLERVRDTSF